MYPVYRLRVKMRIARELILKIGTHPCSFTIRKSPFGCNPIFVAISRTLRIFTSLGLVFTSILVRALATPCLACIYAVLPKENELQAKLA